MTTVIDIRNKIDSLLRTISEYSNDDSIVNFCNVIIKQFQRHCIYDRDLYNNKNYELIKNLYNFLKFRNRWERCFRLDYADCLYYSKYSSRDRNGIIVIINQFFCDMDNIVRQLEDILGGLYEKLSINNYYNDELPKYSFHSKSISINK